MRAPARISPSAAAVCSVAAAANGSPVVRRPSAAMKASPASSPTRTGARSRISSAARAARSASSPVSTDDLCEPLQQRVQGLRVLRPDAGDEDAHEPACGPPGDSGRRGRPIGLRDRQRERGVLGEHRTFQLAKVLAGLDAQLVHERAPGVLVGLQRLGLAVGPVQREHELTAEALAVGVLGDERLELPHDLGVRAQLQARLDVQLDRRHAEIGETRDLALGERLVAQVGERRSAPERADLLQGRRRALRFARVELAPRVGEPMLEAPRVDLLGVDL